MTPAEKLFEEIKNLPEADRTELYELLSEWWCRHCGGDRPCHCWDDE